MLLAVLSFKRSTTLSWLSYTRLLQISRPHPGCNSARCFRSSAVSAVRPTRWSNSDDATLKRLWEKGALDKDIAKQMQFSQSSIYRHRNRLGLAPLSYVPFTQAEDDRILDAKAKGLTWKQISKLFPARGPEHLSGHWYYALSPNAHRKASPRGGRFSSEEDRMLLELRDDRRLRWVEICQHLPGRTAKSLSSRYGCLKPADSRAVITPQSKYGPLLEPVRHLLREGFTITAVAARLGLTYDSTKYLVNKTRCSIDEFGQSRKARKWTEGDKLEFGKLKAEGKSLVDIANQLGRTYSSVYSFSWRKWDGR